MQKCLIVFRPSKFHNQWIDPQTQFLLQEYHISIVGIHGHHKDFISKS